MPPSAQTVGLEQVFTDCVLTLKPAGATITNSNGKTESKAIVRFIAEYLLRALSHAHNEAGVDGFEMF